MITPEEITKKAHRKYRDVLRTYLRDEAYFPLTLSAGKATKDLPARRQQIQALRDNARSEGRTGYDIVWKTINKRDLGEQTIPMHIVIASLEDYLMIIRKKPEFEGFVADVARIRAMFPQLEDWLQQYPHQVIKYHGIWDDLLAVCYYFIQHPCPNVYIRELPIEVHTKFIERHTSILRDLLNLLLPAAAINLDVPDFVQRFGLRDKPSLLRLRLLDKQLDQQSALKIDDISLPVEQLTHLLTQHIKPQHVIIVENLINFLTLPPHPATAALFGGGFAVHLLRHVDWLHHCDIIYWGDIDAHGFQILSDFRGMFPHTRSVLMDRDTLKKNRQFAVKDNQARARRFASLHDDEHALLNHILHHQIRLEQEHIPHQYAVKKIRQTLSASP